MAPAGSPNPADLGVFRDGEGKVNVGSASRATRAAGPAGQCLDLLPGTSAPHGPAICLWGSVGPITLPCESTVPQAGWIRRIRSYPRGAPMPVSPPVSTWIGQPSAGDADAPDPLWRRHHTQADFCAGVRAGRFPRLSDCHGPWRLPLSITPRKSRMLAGYANWPVVAAHPAVLDPGHAGARKTRPGWRSCRLNPDGKG
jgi:hypothetical protein